MQRSSVRISYGNYPTLLVYSNTLIGQDCQRFAKSELNLSCSRNSHDVSIMVSSKYLTRMSALQSWSITRICGQRLGMKLPAQTTASLSVMVASVSGARWSLVRGLESIPPPFQYRIDRRFVSADNVLVDASPRTMSARRNLLQASRLMEAGLLNRTMGCTPLV